MIALVLTFLAVFVPATVLFVSGLKSTLPTGDSTAPHGPGDFVQD
jgi:biopolymer transport protein ExbD